MGSTEPIERDCIFCRHRPICFIREGVERVIAGKNIININGKGTPGKMEDIFIALARACTEWTPDAEG